MAWPRETVPVPAPRWASALWRTLADSSDAASVALLRRQIAQLLGADAVGLLGSARAGLWQLFGGLAARRPGAEVIFWGYNFFAVPEMARLCGLVPVFADAADATGEPSREAVEQLVGRETAGIVVSHHFGRPATMGGWVDLAQRHGLTLLEDCAHAFGARWEGRSVGLFGAGGVFSLSLTKGLVGGAGGVLVTADPDTARGLAAWEAGLALPARREVAGTLLGALCGKVLLGGPSYTALAHLPNRACAALGLDPIERLMREAPGSPSGGGEGLARRLAPGFAAVALAHLPAVGAEIAARRAAAQAIIEARKWQRLEMPPWDRDRESTYLTLVVRAREPEALRRDLLASGFDTRRDYLRPTVQDVRALPVAHRLAREGVYLPLRALGSSADTERLIDALSAFDAAGQPFRGGPGHLANPRRTARARGKTPPGCW